METFDENFLKSVRGTTMGAALYVFATCMVDGLLSGDFEEFSVSLFDMVMPDNVVDELKEIRAKQPMLSERNIVMETPYCDQFIQDLKQELHKLGLRVSMTKWENDTYSLFLKITSL